MAEMPFYSFTERLKDILVKKYIKNVASWLLGNQDTHLLAQISNSSWEVAFTIMFLIDSRKIFIERNEEHLQYDLIKSKSANAVRWLLSKKNIIFEDIYISWDNGTWDTAVVIRAILLAMKEYKDAFSQAELKEITESATKATKWLIKRFKEWEKEVKFPFGPCDIAQILTTLLLLKEDFPDIYKQAHRQYFVKESDEDSTIIEIIEYLLYSKSDRIIRVLSDGEFQQENTVFWDDFFNTAEVIESLGLSYVYLKNKGGSFTEEQSKLLKEIEEIQLKAFRQIENQQIDGKWGAHIDTCRTLYAYIKVSKLIPELLSTEPHITFKALRWMCDEKQIFSDGSFLHTLFVTIFYAHTLIEVYKNWDLSEYPIEAIYDDILWSTPVRTTPERRKHLESKLKNIELSRTNQEILQKNLSLRKKLWTLIATLILILFSFFIGKYLYVFEYSINIEKTFYDFLAIACTLLIFVITLIWSELKK